MALDQQKTIIILVAILLAVVATSITVLLLLPGDEDTSEVSNNDVATSPVPAANASNEFDLQVMDRSDFRALNQRLIQDNHLPVQQPDAIGKANPFL